SDGGLMQGVAVDGIAHVRGWMGNDFALAETNRGVSMVGIDGSVAELVPPPGMRGPTGASGSPNGNCLIYTLGGGMGFSLGFVDARDKDAPSAPELLSTDGMVPALSFVWSREGDWLAYGVPNEDGGIYVWNPASEAEPTRISPDGTSYT